MIALRASFLLAAVLSISACAAPLQNGGVEVLPGAEERLEAMCRYGGASQQKVCTAPPDAEPK